MAFSVGIASHAQQAEVVHWSHEVNWLPAGHAETAVGQFFAEGAHFRGEVPWSVMEVATEETWPGVEVLDLQCTWEAVAIADLTSGQTASLPTLRTAPDVRVTRNSVQITTPLLRKSPTDDGFERLVELSGIFGESIGAEDDGVGRSRVWPASSPLSEGEFIRLSIPEDGVYRIDATLLIDAGLDPDRKSVV